MRSESPEETPAESLKTSRAGRNLPASIAVGVGLLAMVVLSLALVKEAFIAVVAVALLIGLYELTRAFSTAGIRLPVVPVAVGGVAMLVGSYWGGMETAAIAMALTVIGTMVWRLTEGADGFVRDVGAGIFSLSYLFLMGTFVLLMLKEDDGPWRIVAFIIATIASDIGGYIAGVLFGKHPMAPTISPKKSWEGFAGSLLFGIGTGIATVVYALDGDWWVGIILGVAGVVFATLGDLSESLIKRDLGIKDMGDLLPGHGGLMDRLDSLIAVAPIAWLILYKLVDVT
ncbi:phosphatidate cytidylyltransferase [Aeromicrobium sp. SMF47]|uniref:Phosphatidate cytidylyltransferase n=1 Tax=Aeromicrobium yanjiei TaxID=2662028 RepID=A0A5Q2MLL2_9ACTN|nr:phosphatidate cytidylyltransferase [Aeromicrobium yanjiei]MRJ76901.1 phosphatidate cytidylyltransferase [Aeromicrobium yanjiei]QGG41972.1 phosphatidate cytidylyltransferase [Aeromicrobium yanjiei]